MVDLNDQKVMTLSAGAGISVFSVNHAMQKLLTTENGGREDFTR